MVQIWDTPGQERLHNTVLNYFDKAQGIILTYAVNDRKSFESIPEWMAEVRKSASSDVAVVLVGTKADSGLDDEGRSVSFLEGKMLAEKYGVQFFEASAKDNINVDKIFYTLAKEIKEAMVQKEIEREERNEEEFEKIRKMTNLLEPKKRGCFKAIIEAIKSLFKKKKNKSAKKEKKLKEICASMQVIKSKASYVLIDNKRIH